VRAVLFHNVVDHVTDPFDRGGERLAAARFREHVRALAADYALVDFPRARAGAKDPSGRRQMLLTFDDGFAGVSRVALPILSEFGAVATVFILTRDGSSLPSDALVHFERLEIAFRLTTSATLTSGLATIDPLPLGAIAERVRSLKTLKGVLKRLPPAERLERTEQVLGALGVADSAIHAFAREWPSRYAKLTRAEVDGLLAAGWTIGGHTRTHPSVATLDDAGLDDEIAGNARDLERGFGLTEPPFAYPYGGEVHVSDAAEAAIRRAGFTCAFTTRSGDNDGATNPFRLHRYSLPALQAEGLSPMGTARV
jgi:peptidoglycan/xylan/chitin deacetylase (PgdA/CDA1 family)